MHSVAVLGGRLLSVIAFISDYNKAHCYIIIIIYEKVYISITE